MSPRPDVVIVGAGMVGAACAAALAREGLHVETIGEPAGGATAAGMGHIVAMDDSEAQFALTSYSSRLWDALDLPPQVERERRGTLWVAADEQEMAAARAKHSFYTAHGVQAEVLDERALAGAEPELRAGFAGGLRVESDSVVYAPAAAAWLARDVPHRAGATAVSVAPRRVTFSDGSSISCGAVLVAAGVASTALLPQLPIRVRKGHLAITDRYPGFLRHQLVELGYLKSAHGHAAESVAFNVQPRATGQILIGSSRQYERADARIDSPLLAAMLRRAFHYMPRLAQLSVIRTWTGLRAATPDSLPLIGQLQPGPWVAAGHEGLGITTSLGTAAIVADQMMGRATAIPAAPYSPGRAVA
ncbi:MAG: FAD-binding oxidoreductase [Acidobacteria bacterium]|nr:FAD-binding oxidoreductase [Acidobacteriota bacterium]